MKEQWIDDISTKMDGFEMDAPELSWSEIETKVNAHRRHRVVAMWQKRIAVAASLLIIIAASTALFFKNEETTDAIAKVERKSTTGDNDNITSDKKLAEATAFESKKKAARKNLLEISKNPLEIFGNPLGISENALEDSEKVEEASKNVALASTNKNETTTNSSSNKNEKKKTSLDYPEEFSYKKSAKQSRLMASAYYGNGMSMDLTSGGDADFASDIQNDASYVAGGDQCMLASPEEEPIVTADHHQPIRIGLAVKYALSEKWGVETGLVYSYLRSDITEEHHSYTVNSKQKVGYIGIPVAASYDIANAKQLHFYVSAGAMLELPVMAKTDETMVSNGMETSTQERKLPKSALQMSLSGRLGAEYKVTPSLGVYVEPGVSYYFDNGSSIETAYSDKPFNFNINLGVRFTIK